VAANTLIGLEKQSNTFKSQQVAQLETEIKEIRQKHFFVKDRKQKRDIQKQDETKRKQLETQLKKDGWKSTQAEQLSAWNPYDQNQTAEFFDVEWMFGLTRDNFAESPEITLLNQQIEATNKQIKAINIALKQTKIESIIKLQFKTANIQLDIIKKEIDIIKKNIEKIYGTIETKIDNVVREPQNFDYQINSLNDSIKGINNQITEISPKLKPASENPSGYFDLVIGNPPYVNVEHIDRNIKKNIKSFKTAYQKYDLYVLFYEKALELLKRNGILNFITSNKFLSQGYGLLLRRLFLGNTIQQIINFNYNVFESATVSTCIFQLLKKVTVENFIKIIDIKTINDKKRFTDKKYNLLKQSIFDNTDENNFRINLTNEKIKILEKIVQNSYRIDDICSVNYGLRPSSEKLNLKKEAFIKNSNDNGKFKKYFEGKDMGTWIIKNNQYLDYRPDVMYNPMFPELFENEKLVGIRTIGVLSNLRFIYDNENHYCNDSVCILTRWCLLKNIDFNTIKRTISNEKIKISKLFSYKFLQAVLNSSIIKFYVFELLHDGLHFYPNHMKQLPIKKISEAAQQPFIKLVETIIEKKKAGQDSSKEEAEIDAMVYKLYELTDDEIKVVEGK